MASFNIQNGTGTVGSEKYNAIRATIGRIDADIIGFQELRPSSFSEWEGLAHEFGYPYAAIGSHGPFAGGTYLGYFSRYPIIDSRNVTSPAGALELTRFPFRVTIDVPDAQRPLVLWNMHHKSGGANIDKFRRAVEAIRIMQDMAVYLDDNPDHVEYVLLGDMNDDDRDNQTPAAFFSQPNGAPQSYSLGADITFPIAYAKFPTDKYAIGGDGLHKVEVFWENTSIPITRPANRQIDYLFVSPTLMFSSLGAPVGEIYYSDTDTGSGGLAKIGDPLPAGTSANASDHLPVVVDINMADFSPVMPGTSLTSSGIAGGPFAPEHTTYWVSNTNAYETIWAVSADVDWISIYPNAFTLSAWDMEEVEIALNSNASALLPGVHIGVVTFSNVTTHLTVTREVTLSITDHLLLHPDDGLHSAGLPQGPFSPSSKTYVITNVTAASVHWTTLPAPNWVTITPSSWTLLPGGSVDVTVSINANANALTSGLYTAQAVLSNAVSGQTHTRPITLEVFSDLCDAVDACDLLWTTGGDAPWYHQAVTTFDGEDAAQSGTLPGPNSLSWMETVVTGPATLSFQWRVSSRSSWDFLRFRINGTSYASRSGEGAWLERIQELTSGVHTLRWEYARSSVTPLGADAAWVDQVRVTRLTVNPSTTYVASGLPGGPFTPQTHTYTLTNNDTHTPIHWSVSTNMSWFALSPSEGVLSPGGTMTVTGVVTEAAQALPSGDYVQPILFTDLTKGVTITRDAQLNVMDYLVVSPPGFAYYQGPTGGPFTPVWQTYALSNAGVETIHWDIGTTATWLQPTISSGTLTAGEVVHIDLHLTEQAYSRDQWTYDQVIFSNATSQRTQTRFHYLDVSATPIVFPVAEWTSEGPLGGPFAPSAVDYTLSNTTMAAQQWTVTTTSHWIQANQSLLHVAANNAADVTVELTPSALDLVAGSYPSAVLFSNQANGQVLSRMTRLQVGLTLCFSLDACELTWTTGGDASWFPQGEHTHDGASAAASGTITHSQQSWLETTVNGPGTLSYWWKVDSETSWDYLEFHVNSVLQTGRISGSVNWQQQSHAIGPGPHVLRWRYIKDSSVSVGKDRAWLDQVRWIPEKTALGIPTAWYQGFGIEPTNGQGWDALDHMDSAVNGTPNWQMYLTGLDPTDANSVFRIMVVEQAAGTAPRISWWGGLHGPTSPYLIQATTNPATGPWVTIGNSPRVSGTNVWIGDASTDSFRVFRISAEPDP